MRLTTLLWYLARISSIPKDYDKEFAAIHLRIVLIINAFQDGRKSELSSGSTPQGAKQPARA